MNHDEKIINKIIADAKTEGEAFAKRQIGNHEIGRMEKIIGKKIDDALRFLEEIKGVDEKTAMKDHGIFWALVFRERKWYSRMITNYNSVIMLLVCHLRKRGVPLYKIEDIIDILEQY